MDPCSDEEVLADWRERERLRCRLAAGEHAIITQVECRSLPYRHGARSAAVFASQLLRISPGEAHARVRAAAALGPRRTVTGLVVAPLFAAVAAAHGTLLCGHHHRTFQQHDWHCIMTNRRPYWIPPAWIDPGSTRHAPHGSTPDTDKLPINWPQPCPYSGVDSSSMREHPPLDQKRAIRSRRSESGTYLRVAQPSDAVADDVARFLSEVDGTLSACLPPCDRSVTSATR